MKLAELRELSLDELNQKLTECRKQLFELRLQNSVRQLDNTAQLRLVRHNIAQLETLKRQKQLQEDVVHA